MGVKSDKASNWGRGRYDLVDNLEETHFPFVLEIFGAKFSTTKQARKQTTKQPSNQAIGNSIILDQSG
jgi:hypothetical protein